MGKLIPILVIAILIWFIFFHRSFPRMTRRAGKAVRDVGRAGQEILGDEELPDSPLARYEFQVGKALTARVLSERTLSGDVALQEKILAIGRQLASFTSRREITFRFAIIEGAEPDAMAIPGGSIFLTRPLVELCGGDADRIAGLLAHEIAHIDCRHAVKSYATRAATSAGIRLLTLGRGALIGRLAGSLGDMLREGHSREKELEADLVGSELASRAGYDPLGLARFLDELGSRAPTQGVDSCEFFTKHPPLAERIGALQERWKA